MVRCIKKAIGTGKVTSLALIAPGNKPGCVCEFHCIYEYIHPYKTMCYRALLLSNKPFQEFHTTYPTVLNLPAAALLEGSTTSTESLGEKGELLQFWRVLSGCVAASGTDGRRVDLIGCATWVTLSRGWCCLCRVKLTPTCLLPVPHPMTCTC